VAGADRKHVPEIPTAPGVDRGWYLQEPSPRSRFPIDEQLAARSAKYPDPLTPFFEFNRQYLHEQICGGQRDAFGGLEDFFYFEAPGGGRYPIYRHLRHVSPPAWFATNNFGWRGPDVPLERRAGVIRIAFVGSSTTVDAFAVPFSHPELIEHWLNLWAARRGLSNRFEVINAGRTGIDTRSIAAVVQQELVPVDPDLVVFDGGGNQFWPGQVLRSPLRRIFPRPATTFRRRVALERYSALVRRVLSAWDRVRGGNGEEPAKPPALVNWPEGVDEAAPSPHDPRLPMDLPQVLSSSTWLAYPGLKLDLVRHTNIYRYLNDTFWPIPYAHVQRMANFQNRVLAAYGRETGVAFLDIDKQFPRDPDLFSDPIHLSYTGLRLQAWIYLQQLMPIIEQRLSEHRWPRPAALAPATHPAFSESGRRLVTMSDLASHCP